MQEAIYKSSVLIEALPYMQRFQGKYVVVKFGGSVLTEANYLRNVMQDLIFMQQCGMRPVLVHGGGPLISGEMKRRGKKPEFINGQRVTDQETLDIAHDVLVDQVGGQIVAMVEGMGAKAKSVNDLGAIKAAKHMPDGTDLGFVGHIVEVNLDLFDRLAEDRTIPIVSPLGLDESGQRYNINGDVAAWKLASELNAEKLVFLSNIIGVLRDVNDPSSLISTMRRERIQDYIDRGVISGGMIPKVRAAESAIDHGVHKTHIIDGRLRHALLLEIFSEDGVGTQIIPGDEPQGITAVQTLENYDNYVIGNYTRLPIVLAKAKGSRVWDTDGKGYLDLFPGWAVSGTGYCPDRLVNAVQHQATELMHVSNNFHMQAQGELAKRIAKASFGGKTFFCNSGAEANEAALKVARLYHSQKGQARHKIVTTLNSFHGRTFGAVSATGQSGYQSGFDPLVPGFEHVPFNDLKAADNALTDEVAAFMLEPIQGEGGINVASDAYMQGLRKLCDERDILLIVDEVQTCMGRTGKVFAYQHYNITPDIMTLAKSLGGGVPIGAMTARSVVADALKPGTHGSTFGGNSLACRAGIAVFDMLDEDHIIEHANAIANIMWHELEQWRKHMPLITDVRGKALMVGIELSKPGADIAAACLEQGLIINCTQGNVLRLLPALTITDDEIREGLSILKRVMEAHA